MTAVLTATGGTAAHGAKPCLSGGPDLWFAGGAATEEAVQRCYGCWDREGCLDRALELHPVHGVWGATTLAERRRIAAARAAETGGRP